MALKRRHLSLKTKLASALLQLGHISYEESKLLTTEQICSRYSFDHWPIRHADEGADHPSNLTPRLIEDHKRKTAKIDLPEIAKGRRIRQAVTEHARRMLLKTGQQEPDDDWETRGYAPGSETAHHGVNERKPKRRWPSRPFPKRKKERLV